VPDDRVRLDIMFEGGASLTATVPTSVADDLDRALANGDAGAGSFGFEADDGRYVIVVGKVVFVRRSARDQVVGFGATE
jgi:hypothetical protein